MTDDVKRISMVEDCKKEIYIDLCYTEKTDVEIKLFTGERYSKTIARGTSFAEMLKILDSDIHPRYTKIIIDGIMLGKGLRDFIDQKYNRFVEKDGYLFKEDIIYELVEVRFAKGETK